MNYIQVDIGYIFKLIELLMDSPFNHFYSDESDSWVREKGLSY
jgi:hypothetical protein